MVFSDTMNVHQTNQNCQVIATSDALIRNIQTVKIRYSYHKMSLLQESLTLSKSTDDVSDISCHDINLFYYILKSVKDMF